MVTKHCTSPYHHIKHSVHEHFFHYSMYPSFYLRLSRYYILVYDDLGRIYLQTTIYYLFMYCPSSETRKQNFNKGKNDLQPYVIFIIISIIIQFFTHQLQTLKASVTHFFHHYHFPSKTIHVHLEKGCVIIIILIQLSSL
jgi:hypothetical protein